MNFRVSPEELALIEQKMSQLGTVNREAYLRKMALDGYVVKLDLPELKELVSLMRYSSNNLNQLTRIDILGDYLALDTEMEVCKSRYGYIRVEFHGTGELPGYCSGMVCRTPKELFDLLLSDYESYLEIQRTKGRRNVTEEDKNEIAALCQSRLERWEKGNAR